MNRSPPWVGYTQTRTLNGAYSLRELSHRLDTDIHRRMEREILLYLSRNKTGYLYGITKHLTEKKHLPISSSQVGRALDKSASEGLTRLLKGLKLKGHKKGPFYCLTLVGLLKLLCYDVSAQDLHTIIEGNADRVPLLFGEWDYFEKNKVAPKILFAMRYFYSFHVLEGEFVIPNYSRSKKKKFRKKNLPKQQNWLTPRPKLNSSVLTRYILFHYLPMLTISTFETEHPLERRIVEQCRRVSFEWARVWSGKPKLRRYLNEQLIHLEKETCAKLGRIAELKQSFSPPIAGKESI